MALQSFKSRFRRIIRRRKRLVIGAAAQAEQGLERNFFKRLSRLGNVRRFIAGWIGLMVLLAASVGLQSQGLSAYYQKVTSTEGGTLREGIVGTFSTTNPLYASNQVDSSVAKLIFSGLFTHDDNNQLMPDLAEKMEADDKGQIYKISLRKNVKWHDGKPFTASDVVFTYHTIQNPDAKSALLTSWKDVKITALDPYTVQFELPSPLASFPYSLTNGIVPEHMLAAIPPSQLRSAPFNTQPVGTGPFEWESVEVDSDAHKTRSEQIALAHNPSYYLGEPKIDSYILKTYPDENELTKAFGRRELTAVVGVDALPEDIATDTSAVSYNIPLSGSVMLFLNNSSPILSDVRIRQALASATNRPKLLAGLGFTATATDGPLLKGQVGYDPTMVQHVFSESAASVLLDMAGWKQASPGAIRQKDGKPLTISLVSQSIGEYAQLSQALQQHWRAVGVNVDVKLHPEEDIQGGILTHHDYDVLLYGISMSQDPDVFAYWHSSQIDVRSSRLNLSEYKNSVADKALEAGRTRTDPAVRAVKYKPFLSAWYGDVPAISLYEPRFLYITRSELVGFKPTRLGSATDRFDGIQNWTVLQSHALK